MHHFFIYFFAFLCALPIGTFSQGSSVSGYAPGKTLPHKQLEKSFDEQLSAANIDATIKTFSAKPHNVGSPGSKEYAELIKSKLTAYGFDTRIDTYNVLFP